MIPRIEKMADYRPLATDGTLAEVEAGGRAFVECARQLGEERIRMTRMNPGKPAPSVFTYGQREVWVQLRDQLLAATDANAAELAAKALRAECVRIANEALDAARDRAIARAERADR